jgi:hypothetical protein
MKFIITNEPVKSSKEIETKSGFVIAYKENKMVGMAIMSNTCSWTLYGSSYMYDVLGEAEDLKSLIEMFPDYTFNFIEHGTPDSNI